VHGSHAIPLSQDLKAPGSGGKHPWPLRQVPGVPGRPRHEKLVELCSTGNIALPKSDAAALEDAAQPRQKDAGINGTFLEIAEGSRARGGVTVTVCEIHERRTHKVLLAMVLVAGYPAQLLGTLRLA
jgi:hypothetical protein